MFEVRHGCAQRIADVGVSLGDLFGDFVLADGKGPQRFQVSRHLVTDSQIPTCAASAQRIWSDGQSSQR